MTVSRKEFLQFAVIFGGAAAAAALSGCSSSSSTPSTPNDTGTPSDTNGGSTCATNGAKDSAIVGNHGHVLKIPAADFASGTPSGPYSIKGTAAHDHTVTLTAAQLADIAAKKNVTVTSSLNTPGGDHQHDVTIVCA